MSLQIQIDLSDKVKANDLGALWDSEQNTWYIPDKKKISDYTKLIPEESDIIVKNPFFIAVNTGMCCSCKQETLIISIGAEQFLQGEYLDDESEEKEWLLEKQLVLFSEVRYIPKNVIKAIHDKYGFYRLLDENSESDIWSNYCIHCNSLQDDWSNHNQPGGAFFPCSKDEAKVIDLIKVNVNHDFPIVGGYALGDSNDLMRKYSKRL